MILKLIASTIIFIIAIIEKYWDSELKSKKSVKWIFFTLLLASLVFSFFTIVVDDVENENNLQLQIKQTKSLGLKNDSLTTKLDSLIAITENSENNSDQRNIVLQSKIDELDKKLEPFIKLAVKKYPGLRIEDALDKIKIDLAETKKLAAPNKILFIKKEVNKIDEGYSLLLYFKTTKNEPLGLIVISAQIMGANTVRIIDIWPNMKGGAHSTGPDSKKILANGKGARIAYSLFGAGRPVIEIKVTSKCRLHIEGNNELESFDIDV